jgi:zeta-carotene desaturase
VTNGTAKHVVIVGGGVAGLAAALRLVEHGVRVTVVETRQRLGGRATSFNDPATGELLDNCQHVLMRCCTNLIDLYQRLGVLEKVAWHRAFHFALPDGRIDVMNPDPLPAPLHLARSLMRFRSLTWADKMAISRAMRAIMGMSRAERDQLDGLPFADWLKRHRQTERAIRRYWDLVVVSACNEQLDRVSSRYAIQVFQEGFLCRADAYEMGLSDVPLVELYDPAEAKLRAGGGQLLLSSSAEGFDVADDRVTGLRLRDRTLEADAFISAVPFDRLVKLAPEPMRERDARLRGLESIEVSPIIGVHLVLEADQPVMPLPHVVLLDAPIQWVFRKDEQRVGNGRVRQHLHGVVSAAHAMVGEPAETIASVMHSALAKVFAHAAQATRVHHRVVKEKRATFALRPGIVAVRPGAAPGPGDMANLAIAGDWTDTGWPATMEGAARSGYRAAEAALDALGVARETLVVPDVQPGWLYRLIGRW